MNVKIYTEKMFEEIKHIDENGVEFWYARELMQVIEYSKWGNFIKVINKAKESMKSTGIIDSEHIADVGKTIQMPKNATKTINDMKLTRYACYIIVQNADPRKKAIALGQQYFAFQTRKQEIAETDFKELSEDDRRLKLREDVRDFNKKLAFEAQNVGVQNFAKFQNSGYQGLYNGETAGDIKKRKNLKEKEHILDHMGSTELAANYFRITQTEERLKKGDIQGEEIANNTHFNIGKKVREVMIEISGTKPEELPTPKKSIKEIQKEKKLLKKPNKKR
ncbi:DNA damage-inducible protein D [Leptotrichia trevisanii]|uniref:DNA damage-inducible protein D n=1 Tax=Leptotrichia trevisanii TaxID=109328 RepID=UPI00040E599F|nr:DNA damage-inducible protein D [Leptotrichia trevisanii]